MSVCIPGIGQAFAFLPIAKEKGYYQQVGLDVTFESVQGYACTQSLASGKVQFAGAPSTLDGIVKGLPYRVVFVSFGRLSHQMVVAKRVKSYADLKGGKIAISGPGGVAEIVARAALKDNGLNPDKDVTFITIGTSDARQAALMSGAVDASAVPPDEAAFLLLKGLKTLPFKPPPMIGALMSANQDLIKSNPDLVYAFVKASLMGNLMYGKRKSDVLPIVTNFIQSTDSAALAQAYDLNMTSWDENGSLSQADMAAIIDTSREQQHINRQFKPEEVFDSQFDDRAYKELKSSNWQGLWK